MKKLIDKPFWILEACDLVDSDNHYRAKKGQNGIQIAFLEYHSRILLTYITSTNEW